MKKSPRVIRTKAEPVKPENMVITDIVLRNVDRTPKDVATWRNAHINAESVYYPNRTRLYDLYADVTLDGHLTGIMGKRIAAVRNKRLVYKVNGKKVDAMDDIIKSEVFRNIISKINETPAYGVTGLEFVPGDKLAFEEIPRKHIKPEFGVITENQSDYTGFEYDKIPSIWVLGERRDLGYLLKCSFYALIKKGGFSDWAQYVEIFGQPVRVIKYDAYDNKSKLELKQVLDESGSSLTLMIPRQCDFEIADGKTSNGDGQLQERLKNACNDEMSIIVLGNTETSTSNHGGGSNAKAKEHNKQQLEITKDDMSYTVDKLNDPRFIAVLKSYSLPVQDGGKFEFEKELDLDALTLKKDIDIAVSAKVPVDDDYWYDTYGIDKPANYDELKKKMEDEKQLQIQPGLPNPPQKPTGKPGDKPAKKDKVPPALSASRLNAWQKFCLATADFFDLAPRS
jgi:hypothetical protein